MDIYTDGDGVLFSVHIEHFRISFYASIEVRRLRMNSKGSQGCPDAIKNHPRKYIHRECLTWCFDHLLISHWVESHFMLLNLKYRRSNSRFEVSRG